MSIQEILQAQSHRPWDLPNTNWRYYQEWNNALFLHWQVDAEELRKWVPQKLEIDLWEGKAWISLVAFTMENIRPRYIPSIKSISNFHEINIRTYVKHQNKTGVYFLSIEGGKGLSCQIARLLSELPYRFSPMKRENNFYWANNSKDNSLFEARFELGSIRKEKSDLDKFLTERYALFQDSKKGINQFEIHHIEWPIYEVEIKNLHINYPRFNSFFQSEPHLQHYSPGVQVIAWDKSSI